MPATTSDTPPTEWLVGVFVKFSNTIEIKQVCIGLNTSGHIPASTSILPHGASVSVYGTGRYGQTVTELMIYCFLLDPARGNNRNILLQSWFVCKLLLLVYWYVFKSVCLSTNTSQKPDIQMSVTMARSSTGGTAICYVILCIVDDVMLARKGDAKRAYVQSDSQGGSTERSVCNCFVYLCIWSVPAVNYFHVSFSIWDRHIWSDRHKNDDLLLSIRSSKKQ